MKLIGVTGPNGRLGKQLVSMGCEPIEGDISKLKRMDLDKFDTIINCAAVTKVDACQHPPNIQTPEYKRAVEVNVRGVETLRKLFNGRILHLSTDYVFKGDKGPYKEDAKRDPVNDYGYTKYGGEVVLETFPWPSEETMVVRTTGLFGSGSDFASKVIENLTSGLLTIVSKQLKGNHTYVPHLAEALIYIAKLSYIEEFSYLHIASTDVMSRYEFALMIANMYNPDLAHLVKPCLSSEISGWVAPRPTKGGLKVDKAKKMGIPLYSTLDGVVEWMKVVENG